jgi:hypothetical protein
MFEGAYELFDRQKKVYIETAKEGKEIALEIERIYDLVIRAISNQNAPLEHVSLKRAWSVAAIVGAAALTAVLSMPGSQVRDAMFHEEQVARMNERANELIGLIIKQHPDMINGINGPLKKIGKME